jgi:protein-arginine kinase activator protein McsA
MAIDTASNDVIKNLIHRRKERLKETLVRDVDNVEQLHYIRGQIKSLDDLQQDIIDLLKKQEQI